jgi:hypothetical protein
MTLGNMRELGVHHLIGFCLNDSCRHQALVDEVCRRVEVLSFQRRVKCGKCGSRGRWIDVRPNWKEQPQMPTKLRFD